LFETYVDRGQVDDYKKALDHYGLTHVEISDGSILIPEDRKLEYIRDFARSFTVLSEVGSKDAEVIIPPYKWIHKMKTELEAGSWKVIGESRESGTVGIFRNSGEVRSGLIEEILTQIPSDQIIWEVTFHLKRSFLWKHFGLA
jgi:phosphosulfolactate synthase